MDCDDNDDDDDLSAGGRRLASQNRANTTTARKNKAAELRAARANLHSNGDNSSTHNPYATYSSYRAAVDGTAKAMSEAATKAAAH